MIALMPGRFQPFHRGHFNNIVKMIDKGYHVKVVIRDMVIDKKNPWPASIIKQVIEQTLIAEEIKDVQVFVVPDICEDWSDTIKKVVGDFDVVAAGNPRLKMHFDCKKIHTPRKDNPYSATQARKQLKKGEDLQNMLLPSTIEIMQDLNMLPKVHTFWLFGRSGAGKTTLAKRITRQLDMHLLDGDDIRDFVDNKDFSKEGRERHLVYTAFTSQTLNKCGIPVVCALITPFTEVQRLICDKVSNLHLIYIKCSLEEAMRRDVKGLYSKNTPGIDMFEEPNTYDLVVDTDNETIDECVLKICEYIKWTNK